MAALQDICFSISDGDHNAPPKTIDVDSVPFVTISDMRPEYGGFDFSGANRVPIDYYNSLAEIRKPKKGDVVYSVVGSFGIPILVKNDDPFVFQRHIAILRPNNDLILSEYLYYLMRSRPFFAWADSAAIGAAQRTITLSALRNKQIALPSLEDQTNIVAKLRPYDSLIENNQKQIKLLEEVAQRLYKEWFIDLHFPGHEGAENNPETDLPKNWKRCKVKDVFTDITIGKTPSRERRDCFAAKGVPWFSVSDLGKEGLFAINSSESLVEDAIDEFNVKVVPAGTILLSFKLTLGRVSIATQEAATNEAIAHFRSSSKELRNYAYLYLKTFPYETLGSTSSISKAINSKIVRSIPFVLPDMKLLKEFDTIVDPLFEAALLCRRRLEYAKEARNRLLPKLMSGEIGS